jgi:hypothetical protein
MGKLLLAMFVFAFGAQVFAMPIANTATSVCKITVTEPGDLRDHDAEIVVLGGASYVIAADVPYQRATLCEYEDARENTLSISATAWANRSGTEFSASFQYDLLAEYGWYRIGERNQVTVDIPGERWFSIREGAIDVFVNIKCRTGRLRN